MATIPSLGRLLHSNITFKISQSKLLTQARHISAIASKQKILCESILNVKQCQSVRTMSTHKIISEENGETIIRSNYPDIREVETPFGEFMFSYLDKYKHLELMVTPFGEFMFSFLDKYKHLELMVNYPTGQTYTGAQLKENIIKVASALYKQGYRKGDVALLISTNCPEYTIVFIALACIGVVVSTANPIYTSGELARQLTHSGSKTVFCSVALVPVVREACGSSQELQQKIKTVFTIDGETHGCQPVKHLLDDDGRGFPENLDFDVTNDVFTLPYSSGTTGLPKGVMLTHRSLVNNLVQAMEGPMKFKADSDILMGLLPFYHIYGLTAVQFSSLTQGSKLVVHPKFDPETFLQSIQKYKITYAHLVPPVILFLAKHQMVTQYDLSTIHTLISAAAPLGEGISSEVEERLNTNLLQAYGLTESSPLTHYDEVPHKRGTIGRLVPNTRAKVIDSMTGKSLAVGETGEIILQGPQLMKGYLNNQEATDKTIINGWLHTGDIGHADSEGYFIISDRLKELIKYKGYQVAPAELEAVLCTHPGIQDAAVIGLNAGEEVGEIPKAFIVTKPGVNLTDKEVMEFVEKNVAPYKKLRGGVEFTTEIPKTASGKILRRMLK